MHDRPAWERHPNISGLAGMLLAIHDDFRFRTSEVMKSLEARSALRRARTRFEALAATLHHHHQLEEAHLFPAIARKSGRFPDELVGDHGTLTSAIDAAQRALAADDPGRAREALASLEVVLEEHLVREETLVIPILLEMREAEMIAMLYGL